MNTQSPHTSLNHWSMETDDAGIVWACLDKQGSPVNSLNSAVMKELDAIIDHLADNEPRGLVIYSGKSTGFIAGADIKEIEHLKTREEAIDKITQGQHIFEKLSALRFPTVAMISGFCLGGGLELALACRYRVAEDVQKTRLGLPEVMLGLLPAWGGVCRLPDMIGAPAALNMMLNGHSISAKAAEKMGFVDVAVPTRHLKTAAKQTVLNPPKKHKPTGLQALTNSAIARPFLAKIMRKKVNQRVKQAHYPAPFAMIDNWEKYGPNGYAALKESANSFADLLQTPTARNLIRVFFLQEQLKAISKGLAFEAHTVHVVGAGVMGGDIAAWCALRGLNVTLQDREAKYIAPAIKRAYELFKKKLKKPRLIQEAMDRLMPDVAGTGIAHADVVIEAIYENLEAKQALFKEVEQKAKPDAILATNTSSIVLSEIAAALDAPERLVGIHFFNPVAKMPLVEIVFDALTSQATIEHAEAFVKQINRLPLPVKSSPCFLVNRVLAPYLLEAALLLQEGVPGPVIDKVMEEFGMPMGPVELVDTVGLDIAMSVADKYSAHYPVSMPQMFTEKVEAGHLGRKTGKGVYDYKNGKVIKPKVPTHHKAPDDIEDRLVLRMINEAVACLHEGIITEQELLDAGMIFGTGFAPFRGGPIHYVKSQGKDKILGMLKRLEERYGDRFKPSEGWSLIQGSAAVIPMNEEHKQKRSTA